jgi:hypothetical protein
MLNIVIALLLACLIPLQNASADSIVVTVASWHASNHGGGDTLFNEVNPGLGYEHPLNETNTLALGFYNNSYNRNTDYILDIWQPLQWAPSNNGKFKFGLAAGLVSGYEGDSFSFIAVPMLSYEYKNWGMNLVTLIIPTSELAERSVFALQFKVNIP